MSPYQLLILDCDGVMFDTEAANRAYYDHLLAHFGRPPMTPEQLTYVHMHTVDEALALIFGGDRELIERVYEYRRRLDYGRFLKYLSIEPHLRELLARVRPAVRTAIATNRTDTMQRLLAEFGLADHFDLVVTSLDVANPKPHPEPLQKILAHFRLAPGQALYVGDSEVDARAAAAAGVPFAAYRNRRLTADYHLDSLAQLSEMLAPGGARIRVMQDRPTHEEPGQAPAEPPAEAAGEADEPIDWESRRLCSDGNCIGVIGPDGRCKECGKPYEGELAAAPPAADATAGAAGGDESPPTGGEAARPAAPDDAPEAVDDDWESRRLCSDGSCIGVIGPDGRCKECGKPYAG